MKTIKDINFWKSLIFATAAEILVSRVLPRELNSLVFLLILTTVGMITYILIYKIFTQAKKKKND